VFAVLIAAPLLLAAAIAPCNAHPQYRITAVAHDVRVTGGGSSYRASARIAYSLKVLVPAHVPAGDAGLRAHVAGHQEIARKVAASSVGTIQANGSSSTQARGRLAATIERLRSDLERELQREQRAYDNVTENGAAQSQGPAFGFPGGPDARTACSGR